MICKTFEIPIWNGKQNSLTGPVITGNLEKRAPDYISGLARLAALLRCAEMTFSSILHKASQPG